MGDGVSLFSLSRRCFTFLTFVLALPASAQSVDVTSLVGDLDLEAHVERSGNRGCSRSYASSHDDIDVTLDVVGAAVTVLVVRHHTSSIGPSPHRMEPNDEPVRTTQKSQERYTGRARLAGDVLTLTLDRVERASVLFTGWGDLPLPSATVVRESHAVTCRIAPDDVFPAREAPGDTPVRVSLASCAHDLPDVRPATLDFARAAGVRRVERDSMWGESTSVLRF